MSCEDYAQKARAPPKKLLRFADNDAKIALVERNSNRNLVLGVAALARFLEASLTTRQSGMHKIENLSTSRI